jgi:hypothetical protein
MDDLPPPRSFRRRLAVGIWLVLTLVFAGMVGYSFFVWQTSGVPILWFTIVGGIGCFAGIWRWFFERSRAQRARQNGDAR